YADLVRNSAQTCATLGRIKEVHLVPVLACGRGMLKAIKDATREMRAKGTYTLSAPLEVLDQLLADQDVNAAHAYLDLLGTVFGQDISYNRSLRLAYVLPKAVRAFPWQRRAVQISQLRRVVLKDVALIEPFLEGMDKGLRHLGPDALERFVGQGLSRCRQSPVSAAKFLSLASTRAQEVSASLQVSVPFEQIRAQLNRYLQARLGPGIGLEPSPPPDGPSEKPPLFAWSDGRHIHLPEEIGCFDSQDANRTLFKALVRMEAGFFEFGSFHFDLERAAERYPAVQQALDANRRVLEETGACDQERFIRLFSPQALADDLLNLFEQARVTLCMQQRYPGLVKQALPLYQQAFLEADQGQRRHPLARAYAGLALAMHTDAQAGSLAPGLGKELQARLERRFAEDINPESPVEACANLVCCFFQEVKAAVCSRHGYRTRLETPFGRRLRWEAVSRAFSAPLRQADRLNRRLAEKGLQTYRSDLAARLARSGRLSAETLRNLVLVRSKNLPSGMDRDRDIQPDIEALLRDSGLIQEPGAREGGPAFRYPEWSCDLQDYLRDHARVQETVLSPHDGDALYAKTLETYAGLIRRIRRAFELLRPEGLALLRQWPEGDAFDYRALLDFAVDRRAGLIPSDRLFIKRLKQTRDVAVLLLVDVSRSTANPVAHGHGTVLEVAKAALIVFCEALLVVGDQFAIAGFSGTGRHAVDYFRVKDFEDTLTGTIRRRICALAPQRSTRMGAAIRHATAQLQKIPAKVRLLMVLSDGFPNDLGYKGDYAIVDTRRAVQEARARGCFVKAITVNMGNDPRLDELYGRTHHHVIGDVTELPDRLIRLYGSLTRREI
ncbi:MAG: VWA domain-containing protein, partial [Desulfosarcinaceae bacterium]